MSTKSDHAAGAALLAPPPPEAGKAGGAPRGGPVWSFLTGCALGATLSLLLVTVFILPTAGRRAGRGAGGTVSPLLEALDRTNQEASQGNPPLSEYVPPPLWHTMSDEELFKNALALDEVPLSPEAELFPKIAFLLLVRGPIPMAALWNRDFWGHVGKYSIYVHAHPDFEHPPGDGPHLFVNRSFPSQYPNKLLLSAHNYGPYVYNQSYFWERNFPRNLPPLWDQTFGFVARRNYAPLWIGEFGAELNHPGNTALDAVERKWFVTIVSYIKELGLSWTFWSRGPDSVDTGGILSGGWQTPDAAKLAVLRPILHPKFV